MINGLLSEHLGLFQNKNDQSFTAEFCMEPSHDSTQEVRPHREPSAGMILFDPPGLTSLPSASILHNEIFNSTIFTLKYTNLVS